MTDGARGCHLDAPDKADVDTQAAMEGRAVEADEDPISDRSPCGVLGIAVKAHLQARDAGA